jgi:hypothetical protein
MQETKTETAGFRLSPQQQQLLSCVARTGATQCAVLLDGPVEVETLRKALTDVVARHEILRTTFVQPQGIRTPQQVIGEDPQAPVSLEERPGAADLSSGGEALGQLLAEEAGRGFELESGPLLRALIAGAGEASAVLVLTACAACADAASLLVLSGELCDAYNGHESSEEPVQYADYAEWRHELIADEESQMQDGLAFWREDSSNRPAPPRVLFLDRGARPLRRGDRRTAARGRRGGRSPAGLPRGGLARAAGTHLGRLGAAGGKLARRARTARPRTGDRCL